jgi:glycosyltransferase involved in cell wall biosynthesis
MPPEEGVVTVLLPTRNRRAMVEAVLPSYLEQDDVGGVLVLDDASTDGTRPWIDQVARAERRVRVLGGAARLGLPANKNRGLDAVRTRFVFIGEDDVALPPGYVRELLALMRTYHAAVVGSLLVTAPFGERTQASEPAIPPAYWPSLELGPEPRDLLEYGVYSVIHVHAVALLDMTLVGGERYSELFKGNYYREESDLYMRLVERGLRIVLDRRRWFVHYRRPASLANTGSLAMGWFGYEQWCAANNAVFMARHWGLLRKHRMVGRSMLLQRARFRAGRLTAFARSIARNARRRLLSGLGLVRT